MADATRSVVAIGPNNPVFDLPIYIVRDEGLSEKAGTSRAVAMMEPFISMGLKDGARLVDATFHRGAEVVAASPSPEQREAYLGAINAAADLRTAKFGKYKHYVTEQTQGRLASHELSDHYGHYPHYPHYVEYEPKRFDQVYEWMKSWGLAASDSADHATRVAGW